eukprot:7672113-Pyramimonas_sp.AAC.1
MAYICISIELCFAADMAKVALAELENSRLQNDAIRICVSAAAKRAVVAKEDDLLAGAEILANSGP